ncbi:MAG: 30S ribosomal protein S12 methylthiotransferase RimO [Pseudomonadota bacterium]
MGSGHKVSFVSLGCPKALVDSEHIVTALLDAGYDVVAEQDDDAEVVVVNTCGFIDAAKQESIDTISQAYTQAKKVVVTGCMGKDPTELRENFADLDFVSGPAEVAPVLSAVQSYAPVVTGGGSSRSMPGYFDPASAAGQRVRLTPEHYAYLKISEGCNHKCSFCIIPKMRGALSSRESADVLAEAEQLVEEGVKELLVVAQDLSAYGLDIRYRESRWRDRSIPARLLNLCDELGSIAPWVRLHYVYPYPHVDHIIPLMSDGKILPYLDMPLQHASTDVLKAMRRPAALEKTLERLHRWRQMCPELVVRSTFIVGFPGETDQDVGALLDFLEEADLDRVGCFTYSAVEGAAANALDDHVDERDKIDRQEMVYEVQAPISARHLAAKRGRTIRVLIDDARSGQIIDGYHAIGRSSADAPEIDGSVHIRSDTPCREGEFVWVKIDDSDEHDLFGELVGESVRFG